MGTNNTDFFFFSHLNFVCVGGKIGKVGSFCYLI